MYNNTYGRNKPMQEIEAAVPQPDRVVYMFHQTFARGSTHDALERACARFFEEYFTLPTHIAMSSLERIQLPITEWEYFKYNRSLPIKLCTTRDECIPKDAKDIELYYGYILCIGNEPQYIFQTRIVLEDTPLSLMELLVVNPVQDFIAMLVASFKS
jgi:hypothetical protein